MARTPSVVHSAQAPKCRQVLEGARAVFREQGFERATMDRIAAAAGVSKATLYSHFQDKRSLYAAYLSQEVDELRASVRCMLLRSEAVGDIRQSLQHAGASLVELTLDPVVVRFYRNTSAEVERFPELGQLLFDNGPATIFAVIRDHLEKWQARGLLHLDDPQTAAVHFVMLCHGDLITRSQLAALPHPLKPAIVQTVQRGVAAFLAAYG